MPEDVQAATSAVTEESRLSIETMSHEERTAFLESGTLPGEEKPLSDGDAKAIAESGAASDAAKDTQEPKRETRAERRIRQLHAENKKLAAELETTRQRPIEQGQQQRMENVSSAPKLKSFTDKIGTTYEDYEAAHDAWENANDAHYANQSTSAVQSTLQRERDAADRAKADDTAKQIAETNAKEFAKRAETFRKTLKADTFAESFAEVCETVNEALATRPEMTQIAAALVESDLGPELVHYFGQHPDELDALLEYPISRALRELGKLEASDKIKAPAPRTRTAARRIGSDVAGRTASSADPEQEAVEKRDMLGYLKASGSLKATESVW